MRGLILVTAALMGGAAPAATRVEVTADNSIVLYRGEEHLNAGGQRRIRIKGNQHLVALQFDTRALRGKRVRSAVLVCHRADKMIDGVTISTIAAPWDEGLSNALTSGKQSFRGWAWPGARFPAVTGSNSFTLACQAKSVLRQDAYHWTVDPDLIHANAIGAAHGLTIHEVSGDYSRNPTIWSREQKDRAPYLVVTFAGTEPTPLPAQGLRLEHDGDLESLSLTLTAPTRGFAYDVEVGGRKLPRWCVPFVRPGQKQTVRLRDLKLQPGHNVRVSVVTINRVGQRSQPASVTARLPQGTSLPLPHVPPLPSAATREPIAVIPLLDKYDIDGSPVGDLPEDYRWRNEVFDGETIRLSAARGEVVGFQLLLKGSEAVRVQCEIGGMRAELYRGVYVESKNGRIPDPLVPFQQLALSPTRATPVAVDVFVPFDCGSRSVRGAVSLSDGRRIPIALEVHDFALPRRASFLCEMNSYGLPSRMSEFYGLQEIAYDHRVHCNILYYGHRSAAPGARKCVLDKILDVGENATGQRMDEKRFNDIRPGATTTYWDDFVAAFGPHLTGEHYAGGHRGPIPAPGFYLMFHESWPLNVRAHFNGDPDAYEAFKHSPEYSQTFVSLLRDFIRVAKRQGWTGTGFQLYLNNKGKIDDSKKSPWILDEPTAYWDYRALAFYADLVRRARGRDCPIRLDYRIDISRPQFDRGQLWRKADLWVINSRVARLYPGLIRDRTAQRNERFWVYGTTNPVEVSNRATQAWVLEAFRLGACGIVPWQTVDKKGRAMTKADQLGLFILTKAASGRTEIRHSLRLKAYRRAQQDVEYLTLLRERLGLTLEQMRQFVGRYVSFEGEVRTRYAADAGTAHYRDLSPEQFRRLRAAAAQVLTRR